MAACNAGLACHIGHENTVFITRSSSHVHVIAGESTHGEYSVVNGSCLALISHVHLTQAVPHISSSFIPSPHASRQHVIPTRLTDHTKSRRVEIQHGSLSSPALVCLRSALDNGTRRPGGHGLRRQREREGLVVLFLSYSVRDGQRDGAGCLGAGAG